MLDLADFVAVNKFDRSGSADALRDVARQYGYNRGWSSEPPEQLPVYGTQASRFDDDGVTALYQGLRAQARRGRPEGPARPAGQGRREVAQSAERGRAPLAQQLPGGDRRHRAGLSGVHVEAGQVGPRAAAASGSGSNARRGPSTGCRCRLGASARERERRPGRAGGGPGRASRPLDRRPSRRVARRAGPLRGRRNRR